MTVNTRATSGVVPVRNAVAALVVSVAGVGMVWFNSLQLSAVAYLLILLIGSVLIYRQRRAAFKASLGARSRLSQRVPVLERVAVVAVLLACVANGIIVALHLSRMEW